MRIQSKAVVCGFLLIFGALSLGGCRPSSEDMFKEIKNFDKLKKMIEKGGDVNSKESITQMTLLHYAAYYGDLKIVALLAEKGADIHAQDAKQMTALDYAHQQGHEELINWFREKGLSQRSGSEKQSPLHMAVLSEDLNVIYALLAQGANPNEMDLEGKTTLHLAAEKGNSRIASLLVQRGAEIKVKDKQGRTPLHYAALSGDSATVQYILSRGAELEAKDNAGLTSLGMASLNARLDIVLLLAYRGAALSEDLLVRIKDYQNPGSPQKSNLPLDINPGIIKPIIPHYVILEEGGVAPGKVIYEFPLLDYALLNGNQELSYLIINQGFISKKKSPNGQTPLHLGALMGLSKIVELLVQKKLYPIDVINDHGETPLVYTLRGALLTQVPRREYEKIAIFLVENGAEIFYQDRQKKTLLHYACEAGLQMAAEKFIQMGLSLDERDDFGNTPLLSAASFENKNLIRFLLDKAVDIQHRNYQGKNALHLAVAGGAMENVQYLLWRGVKFDVRDNNGDTPLHLAVRTNFINVTTRADITQEIIRLLIYRGADLKSPNGQGKTPLQLAEEAGQERIVRLLKYSIR